MTPASMFPPCKNQTCDPSKQLSSQDIALLLSAARGYTAEQLQVYRRVGFRSNSPIGWADVQHGLRWHARLGHVNTSGSGVVRSTASG